MADWETADAVEGCGVFVCGGGVEGSYNFHCGGEVVGSFALWCGVCDHGAQAYSVRKSGK